MLFRTGCHRWLLCLITLPFLGCDDAEDAAPASGNVPPDSGETVFASSDPALEAQVRAFCGDCHVTPRPESFARDAWYDEVRRGYDFYFESGRSDLDPPPQARVVEYFRSLASEELPEAEWENSESTLEFVAADIDWETFPDSPPAISFLEVVADENGEPRVFWSDMRSGEIGLGAVDGEIAWSLADVADNPCALASAYLDGNDDPDLLVTDLGSFLPEDHDLGKLICLPDKPQNNPVILLEDVGRVSDVRDGDFDGDGDTDLIVAVFGWHETGGIHLLTNDGDPGRPSFMNEVLDDRPGTIHLPTIDLNEDGRLDFVALISQEHETITAFINEESGFRKVELFNAPDPAYGSSGIELTDLDLDGDTDILYTNGDTFDSHEVKPYHGISWLENQGELKFVVQRLTTMPGVHRALAADLDLDGDQDIAAVALLPARTLSDRDPDEIDSVIWLEQTAPGTYLRHLIESGRPNHATLVLGDVDGDGDVDLIAGSFLDPGSESRHAATVFWNQFNGETQSEAAE